MINVIKVKLYVFHFIFTSKNYSRLLGSSDSGSLAGWRLLGISDSGSIAGLHGDWHGEIDSIVIEMKILDDPPHELTDATGLDLCFLALKRIHWYLYFTESPNSYQKPKLPTRQTWIARKRISFFKKLSLEKMFWVFSWKVSAFIAKFMIEKVFNV
jgi:hypothetical protein